MNFLLNCRDERGMADYAARLGELLTALELFDVRHF